MGRRPLGRAGAKMPPPRGGWVQGTSQAGQVHRPLPAGRSMGTDVWPGRWAHGKAARRRQGRPGTCHASMTLADCPERGSLDTQSPFGMLAPLLA